MEPYDPIPGRVPRKVAIDRRKKEYASFSIEQLLAESGNNFEMKASISLKKEKNHGFLCTTLMTQPLTTIPTKDGLRRKWMKMEINVD